MNELAAAIVREYKAGKTYRQIAREYKVSLYSISKLLASQGLDQISVYKRRNTKLLAKLDAELKQGHSGFIAARNLNIDYRRVYTLMTYLGHGQQSLIREHDAKRRKRSVHDKSTFVSRARVLQNRGLLQQ